MPRPSVARAAPGLPRAVQVPDAPLAHTTMLLGTDASGAVAGDVATRVRRALDNADLALAAAGSSLREAVKINFCLASDADVAAADAVLAQRFRDRPVAASWSRPRCRMPEPE